MIPDILDYLGGRIPLGLWLLPVVGGLFSCIWWVVWKGTNFWGIARFRRVMLYGWMLVVAAYMVSWIIRRPPPIPLRVIIYAAEPGEKSPGVLVEAVTDAIRSRLETAPEGVTILDAQVAPAAYSQKTSAALDALLGRMRCRFILRVWQDSAVAGGGAVVHLSLRKWSLFGYGRSDDLSVPPASVAQMMTWGANQVASKMGLTPTSKHGDGRLAFLSDSLLEKHYLTFSLRRLGETDVAAAFLKAEALADSHWADPRIELARTYLTANPGPYEDEIRTSLLDAARLDRENPETFLLLGRHFLEFRAWEEAESALKLAYNLDPANPRILFYLSRLMPHRLDDLPFKTPEELIARALQLSPGYEDARLTLVENLRGADLKQAALAAVQGGLKIDPKSDKLLLTESAVLIEMREYGQAEAICRGLLSNNPDSHEALYNLGLCKLWTKDYDRAIAAFDSSLNRGGTIENYYYLGAAYQFKGDFRKAIFWLEKRFAAMKTTSDEGAINSRKRIKVLREWIEQDSLELKGYKRPNMFERAKGKLK